MARVPINNGDTGLDVCNALNGMFTELYGVKLNFSVITPSGAIDGSNTIFTLPSADLVGVLVHNGLIVIQGLHYTRVGDQITMNSAPSNTAPADWLRWINLSGE